MDTLKNLRDLVMGIQLNRYQIEQIVNRIGDSDFEEVVIEIGEHETGPEGPGIYAWWPEYPEEGKALIAAISTAVKHCENIAMGTNGN